MSMPVHGRWRDFLRESERCGAAAAADINDPLAGLGPGAVDQNVGDRLKQDILDCCRSAQRWPPGPFQ